MKFYKSEETLDKIKAVISAKEKGAYLRFGDGDVNLANNAGELLQSANPRLGVEMREAFAINHPNVLKTLPLYSEKYGGLEDGMFDGNHKAPDWWCDDKVNMVRDKWNGEMTDVYSTVALHHLSTMKPQIAAYFLKFIKQHNVSHFIGNENIPRDVVNLLFGVNCIHIKTPTKSSYDSIDSIEQNFNDNYTAGEYSIIVTAMGCSGRALQKRLYNRLDNMFLFDFGSLMDALCGWNTRAWIELTNFNKDEFIKLL